MNLLLSSIFPCECHFGVERIKEWRRKIIKIAHLLLPTPDNCEYSDTMHALCRSKDMGWLVNLYA